MVFFRTSPTPPSGRFSALMREFPPVAAFDALVKSMPGRHLARRRQPYGFAAGSGACP
jgi:hypothetical protein